MAKEKPKNKAVTGGTVDPEATSGFPLADSSAELLRPREFVAPVPDRWELGEWWRASARTTFGALLPELFAGAFGGMEARRFAHARVLTDFADTEEHLEFGGVWSEDPSKPFHVHSDARSTIRITSDLQPGLRIGVLLHYRPRGSDLIGFAGERLPSEPAVLVFVRERAARFRAVVDERKLPENTISPTFFDLEFEREGVGDLTDILISAPPQLIQELGLVAGQPPHHAQSTAKLALADWKRVGNATLAAFLKAGGDLLLSVALVSENWQDRWVGPEQKQNIKKAPELGDRDAATGDPSNATLPSVPPLTDLMSVRAAAKLIGVSHMTVQRALDAKRLNTFTLGDERPLVSLSECRTLFPNGANPVGRPPKNRP